MNQNIKTEDVVEFFNRFAPSWDENSEDEAWKINKILDNAGVKKGSKVLDVACGTGVLIPYYLERGVSSVLGVDISQKMVEIACSKFKDQRVGFKCINVMDAVLPEDYDCIVIYNAFPHFPWPEALIKKLSCHLAKGGTITVAHGASREAIDKHHSGSASKVSIGLMPAEELSQIMGKYAKVTCVVSNGDMYQVTAQK